MPLCSPAMTTACHSAPVAHAVDFAASACRGSRGRSGRASVRTSSSSSSPTSVSTGSNAASPTLGELGIISLHMRSLRLDAQSSEWGSFSETRVVGHV
eukprot:4838470-Pyramimonas_sp.AAC.1